MNTTNSSNGIERGASRTKLRNRQLLRAVQISSRTVSLIFLAALVWAIYQAIVNNNPLPAWAWLGMVVLFAAALGLGVALIVYKGVANQVGPFDYRPSSRLTGELKQETRQVVTGGANSLRADIRMSLGVFHLSGGSTGVLDAAFTYDDADWKPPVVEYGVDGLARGSLVVEQKATGRPAMRQGPNEWVLHLNQDLPTDLNLRFGAGKADLKLSGLRLEKLRVESGVGELLLDLSGTWRQGMSAFIKASIGDTTLRLPEGVGVRIHTTIGLGSIGSHGLSWDGDAYTNALYGRTPVDLEISIQGGMGKIKLESPSLDEKGVW